MTRARGLRIADAGRDTRLPRALRRWLARELVRLDPVIAASAAAAKADRYRKHFFAREHAHLLLFHGLAGSESLEESYASFAACPALAPREEASVSYSHLAASNTSRPADFLAGLIPVLLQRVRDHGPISDLPPDLRLIDATFLRLAFGLAPWVSPVQQRVKVQVTHVPAYDLPEQVLVLATERSDCASLDLALLKNPARLIAIAGKTLVFDLGFYSHVRFRLILNAGAHLVTRLLGNASYQEVEDRPLQQPLVPDQDGRITVTRDQRIRLGSTKNHSCKPLANMRLVTACVRPTTQAKRQGATEHEYRLITDRWDLSAREVVQTYLWRWQIELFFRWLKHVIKVVRLIGWSTNAVSLSVHLAIIVHLLTLLAAPAVGLRRLPGLVQLLAHALITLSLHPLPAYPRTAQLPLMAPT